MSLSKLAERCKICLYQTECDHKEMECVGFLTRESALESCMNYNMAAQQVSMAIPMSRPTVSMITTDGLTKVYKDELRDQLYSAFGVSNTLLGGKIK